MPGVVTAWTPATLGGASPQDLHAIRWWRALPHGFAWLVCGVAKPGYIWADGPGWAAHGTTNAEDVDVPILFMGPAIQPGMYPDTVPTTDIGPTLARLLHVKTEGRLDGRALKKILK
jgi:arylsulfatase A-like enzyme